MTILIRIAAFLIIFAMASCCSISEVQKDMAKSAKSKSASDRIKSSEQNSQSTLKDLDE